MKIVVLDAATFGDDIDIKELGRFGSLEIFQTTTPQQIVWRTSKANIVVTNKVIIDQSVIEASPHLKLICVAATGMNNVDVAFAANKRITVKNVAGYSTESVAQHTFAMLFYLLEQLRYYDDYVKSGKWSQSPIFTHLARPFWEISGKQWGIIGLGAIGKEVARIASAFGAKVVYYSTSNTPRTKEYPMLQLEELLATSHIISIHAPLNEKTTNLLNYERLCLLKKGAILLNLGRGGIVNEEDLARALDSCEIYAGLDVLAQEPITADHPLLRIAHPQRLLITPHTAWTSREARIRLIKGVIRNIETFLKEGE